MKTIAKDRRRQSQTTHLSARGVTSVSSDLDKLLAPKSLAELEKLERQINAKLASNEPIDTDYWEHLLSSLLTYKAKAKLRNVTRSIMEARLGELRNQQAEAAAALVARLKTQTGQADSGGDSGAGDGGQLDSEQRHVLDPEPLLRLRPEDKALESTDAQTFTAELARERRGVSKLAYAPMQNRAGRAPNAGGREVGVKRARTEGENGPGQASTSLFDREIARGLHDNEELFTNEEEVETKNRSQWAHQHRPRKPRYFNRVISGYEWNKYNQTHYDHENPPPKVVQGYKFNIFYPDLVDNTRAPTYRIERENGRKRGQTFAPAGENDTCLIRFIAGPPYEDIAFRIVDREWDFSAKRERGFKSSFDKVSCCVVRVVRRRSRLIDLQGMLVLHFQFKKVWIPFHLLRCCTSSIAD